MTTVRVLYHLARADFLERVRRYNFLVTLLALVVVTYLFVPALDAPVYIYVKAGDARPVYTSAWVATVVALLLADLFPLFAFFLARGALERDQKTGVGQIIATTPLPKPFYTLGKWLSNAALFTVLTLAIGLTTAILQWVRAEDLALDIGALAGPLLIVFLPQLVVVGALAIFAESTNLLRGGLGVVAFLVVWSFAATVADFEGVQALWPPVHRACAEQFTGECLTERQIEIDGRPLADLPTFRYTGTTFSLAMIAGRLGWLVVAAGIAWAAARFFHRFDPDKMPRTSDDAWWQRSKHWFRTKQWFRARFQSATQPPASEIASAASPSASIRLRPLPTEARHLSNITRLAQLFRAEWGLTFRGVSWVWLVGAVSLSVLGLALPLEITRFAILPLAWLWPLARWSGLGTREAQHHTEGVIFSTPHPLQHQLPMTWAVGVSLSLLMGAGVMMRLALAGELLDFAGVLVGALFIPTLALALGCWSGTPKVFEAIYLFTWYLAAVQGVSFLDFMGHFPGTAAQGLSWAYAGLTVALLIAAFIGRYRKVQN